MMMGMFLEAAISGGEPYFWCFHVISFPPVSSGLRPLVPRTRGWRCPSIRAGCANGLNSVVAEHTQVVVGTAVDDYSRYHWVQFVNGDLDTQDDCIQIGTR